MNIWDMVLVCQIRYLFSHLYECYEHGKKAFLTWKNILKLNLYYPLIWGKNLHKDQILWAKDPDLNWLKWKLVIISSETTILLSLCQPWWSLQTQDIFKCMVSDPKNGLFFSLATLNYALCQPIKLAWTTCQKRCKV